MKTNLSNLWRWDGTVGRGEYFFWGALLFVVKYNFDRLLSAAMLDRPWTLFDRDLESKGGQFRLVPLDGGGTLPKGTTWYHHHLWPARYWQAWSDFIIHKIHLRVLDHVKQLSERSGA